MIDKKEASRLSKEIVNWLSEQSYGGEPLLHAAVCCDFVGRSRFIKAIAFIIQSRPQIEDAVLEDADGSD